MKVPTGIHYNAKKQTASGIQSVKLREVLERAQFLSFFFAIVFGAYAFTSIEFIQKFSPSTTLIANFIERLFLHVIPFLCLGQFLKCSKISDIKKFIIWSISYSLLLFSAGLVFIWPIALNGNPEIMPYIQSANNYLFSFPYVVLAPPGIFLYLFTGIISIIFVLPLFVVTYLSGDMVIFKLVMNDSVFTIISGIIMSKLIDSLRTKIAVLEEERNDVAKKFLGPVVSEAIYEKKSWLLKKIRCKGFVVSIDIRDSTELSKKYQEKWLDFRSQYFSAVGRLVLRYHGHVQKTIGDCHIINFGIMNEDRDLSDIPGLEHELALSEDRRLQDASRDAFQCLEGIVTEFQELASQCFPSDALRLGAGIDKGQLERAIHGDSSAMLELDINGDPVNCCSRLQDYSKELVTNFDSGSSLLVISPFASDYLPDLSCYRKVETISKPIRNYPQMKWILVREFKQAKVKDLSKAC